MASTHETSTLSDTALSHRRHQDYTYRLPSPPRILIPPPSLATEMPCLDFGQSQVENNNNSGRVDTSFLNEINLDNILRKNGLLDWSYERRRQAQMILPFLYLGPMVAVKDAAYLKKEGITMVFAIRTNATSMSGALRVANEMGLAVQTMLIPNYQSLISNFSQATEIINRHLASVHHMAKSHPGYPPMGKVLVFCESGNEKSAGVVAAYLMEMLDDLDYTKAMQVCQAQRFCVNFDDNLKHLLSAFWDIVQARRMVAQAKPKLLTVNFPLPTPSENTQIAQVLAASSKRSIDDTFDEDMEMDDGLKPSDGQRFSGRDITPFEDSRF